MRYSDQSYNLRIELDTKQCELSGSDISALERRLDPLRDMVAHFPVCDLYITIERHPRSSDYGVKTALVLSGRTITTGEHAEDFLSPFEHCVRKLMHRVRAYEESMQGTPETRKHEKGTAHSVIATQEPDVGQLHEALREGDYAQFRQACYVYEEAVRKRAGRWIARYPEAEDQLGDTLSLAEIVEEVFLNAFAHFERRPAEQRFGDWLDDLIDPSIKALLRDPRERENVRFAQSAQEIERQ